MMSSARCDVAMMVGQTARRAQSRRLSEGVTDISTQRLPSAKLAVLVVLAGLVFLLIAGVFAARYSQSLQHRAPIQRSADVTAIAGWMTLHYIARAYSVPEPVLLAAVHLNEQEARRLSLDDIAQAQHKSPEEIIAAVRSAILQYKTHPSTTPVAPGAIRRLPQAGST